MKPEKMTDEALKKLTEQAAAGQCIWRNVAVLRLLAHIAALEAEREHWESETKAHDSAATQYESDIKAMRKDLERERSWKESARLERDALSERVQALERERIVGLACLGDAANTMFKTAEQAANYLKRVVSDLAAIRQRAMSPEGEGVARDAWERALAAREHGPAAFLLGIAAYRSHIVGDTPVDGGWEGPAHPSPERDPSDAPEVCAEPTTTEAFAEVREAMEEMSEGQEQRPAWRAMREELSLLERRMGAMARVLGLLLKSGTNCRWVENGERIDLCAMARAALIDAPPVFTLEEVEKARVFIHNAAVDVRRLHLLSSKEDVRASVLAALEHALAALRR